MSSSDATRARDVMAVGGDVVVVWGDGHESYFPGEPLRRACTCAECKGEGHLFGRATLPVLKPLRSGAFEPVAVALVGNYGLQVTWGDGHDYGIYTLAELRAACPCAACRAGSAPAG